MFDLVFACLVRFQDLLCFSIYVFTCSVLFLRDWFVFRPVAFSSIPSVIYENIFVFLYHLFHFSLFPKLWKSSAIYLILSSCIIFCLTLRLFLNLQNPSISCVNIVVFLYNVLSLFSSLS